MNVEDPMPVLLLISLLCRELSGRLREAAFVPFWYSDVGEVGNKWLSDDSVGELKISVGAFVAPIGFSSMTDLSLMLSRDLERFDEVVSANGS